MKLNYIIKKLIIILIAITLIVPISCQKTYEDGPWVSLRSPIKRLLGSWMVNSYKVNGIEKVQEYNDSCGCEWSFAYRGVDQHELMAINCNESFHYQEFIHSSSY